MNKTVKSAGDKIFAKNASWSFSGKVAQNFNNHILRSVPFYLEGHKIIINLSDFFLKNKSICYDLGCSTGTLLKKLNKKHQNKSIILNGVDSVKEMVNFSKKRVGIKNKNTNKIKFIKKDLKKLNFIKNDLVISYYTMQFVKPEHRQSILNKIYKSLKFNGGLIIFEKTRASDARFQDIFNAVYNEFKIENNYSFDEIMNKYRSLKGVLEPFTDKENLNHFKKAGFSYVTTIFQWTCFKGYLCIK